MQQYALEIKKEDQLECIYCSQDAIEYKNKILCQECKISLQSFQKEVNLTLIGGLCGIVISGLVLQQVSGSIFSFGALFGTVARTIYILIL